jgi:GT2 family glycosyltransferase
MSPGNHGLRVSVVLPVYNRSDVLTRTLSALSAQDYPPDLLTVIVADDGSSEDITSVFDSWSPPFEKRLVRQDHHGFGAGRARNLGATAAASDIVVFLDSDALVAPDFVSRHTTWHADQPKAVVIGGRVHLSATGFDPVQLESGSIDLSSQPFEERDDFRTVLTRRTSRLRSTDEGYRAFVSSNVSLSSSLFAATGGFDERFRWWGSEDSEYGWRLWQAGARFVDDQANRIYHQIDADTAGGSEGRQEARELNRGLLTSLVPQRFYRKGMPEPPPEVPKFSIMVHDVPELAPGAWWRAMIGQTLPDFELLFLTDGASHDPFAGAAEGERRIQFIDDLDAAIEASRGEYLVFLSGYSAAGPTLLQNLRKRLDDRPAATGLTFGVDTPDGEMSRPEDLHQLETDWRSELPLALAVRRRALIMLLDQGTDVSTATSTLRESDTTLHTNQALVALPGSTRVERPPGFSHTTSQSRQLFEATQLGAGPALQTGLRLVKTRFRPPRPRAEKTPIDPHRPPGVRYVGWVGKDNLGDEAMLDAARKLMPWGEIEVRGEARDLLLLGGGTLINRNLYLKWLTERDSPRIERAVLGTGVASPGFWGLTEDPSEWLRWLGTCAYVGVRGPRSAQTLDNWGFKGKFEVCGDPALALEPSTPGDGTGPILVAPAWTNGELWGGSDHDVYRELAAAIRIWEVEGREVTLMSCHPTDDRPILLIKEMLGSTNAQYLAGYLDVQESLDRIAGSALVIGERLHACVLAAAAGRPFVAIEYRPKLEDFAESVAMGDYLVRTDEMSGGRVVELAAALGTESPAAMEDAVASYRELLNAAASTIESAVTA